MIAPDNAYCEMRARSLGVALGVLLKYDLADNAETQFWPGHLARASQDQDLPLL